jgi:hypothetical protein
MPLLELFQSWVCLMVFKLYRSHFRRTSFKNYYEGSISASDIIAHVIDHPNVVFEVQCNAAFPVADLFGNFDIVDGSPVGDTKSGRSNTELHVSTGNTTATLPLKALDISDRTLITRMFHLPTPMFYV